MTQQFQLFFQDALQYIDKEKQKRSIYLKEHNISDKDIDLLLKITFDLTYKDFEYLIKFLLVKDKYINIDVSKSCQYQDYHGNDIIAEKDNNKYYYQCKQWKNEYVHLKKLGEYYATIFHTKKNNPNAVFTYITTSYIKDDLSKEFLKDNHIKYIDHKELISWCKCFHLDQEGEWCKLIYWIQQERLKGGGGLIPYSKEDLLQQRLQELRTHLKPLLQKRKILLLDSCIDFAKNTSFFQYWNLI